MHTFREFLQEKSYPHESEILAQLPKMDMAQQIEKDIELHQGAIGSNAFGPQSSMLANDSQWKHKLLDIISGKERSPEVIQQTARALQQDITSHLNRTPNQKTGSNAWHQTWISVYQQWLNKLAQILGVLDGKKE